MIFLAPVSRFRVTYEVIQGLPYSHLERLVLRAVSEGVGSRDELVSAFRVHPRLLIESLVTLTHAGWIAIGGGRERQFLLTPEGRRAVRENTLPAQAIVSQRKAMILLDRLTGALIPEGEARYVSRKELVKAHLWDLCTRLPAEVWENRLDEGQVQILLPRQQGERIRWIGPIDMLSKGAHYIPISIEPDGRVVNIPSRCAQTLRPYIEELTNSLSGQPILSWSDLTTSVRVGRGRAPEELEQRDAPSLSVPADVRPDDVLLSIEQHTNLFRSVLSEAHSSVLISSAAISGERIEGIAPLLWEALARGVSIDVLWSSAETANALAILKEGAYRAKGGKGVLRFNSEPSGTIGNVLLWDSDNGFQGVVGIFEWLGGLRDPQTESGVGSVVIRNGVLVSCLARLIAGFWSLSPSEALSSVPDKWRSQAFEIEAQRADERHHEWPTSACRLIAGAEHLALIKLWSQSAQRRFVIKTDQCVEACVKNLGMKAERGGAARTAILSGSIDEISVADLVADGGFTVRQADIGGDVIVADDIVCFTTFRILGHNDSKALGVMLESSSVADLVTEWLLRAGP